MSLPTLAKSWLFAVNSVDNVSTIFTGHGATMYPFKEALISLGSNPWTVVSSSDGLGNFGASDLWSDAAHCQVHNSAGSNHSWIVLQQTALGTSFQMLFNMNKNGGGQSTIVETYFSEGGLFTSGSATNRPTATDEVVAADALQRHNWWDGLSCDTTQAVLQVTMSDDGEITRWWIYQANECKCLFSVEKPKDAVSGWTNPWLAVACVDWYAGANVRPTFVYLNDLKTHTVWRSGGVKQQLYLTCEGFGTAMLGQTQTYVNDLDGAGAFWPMFAVGLFCDTASYRGRHGVMTDIWWGSVTRADGDHYPSDASRQFAQVGDLILPWLGDGTVMQTA